MDIARRRFLTFGVLCATAIIAKPVLACPNVEKIVTVAKTFVGSTDYKDDSLQLCFDVYHKAKIRLREQYDTTRSHYQLTARATRKIKDLKTQHGAIMIWQRNSMSAPMYAALYLGGDEVLTSWRYKDGFTPTPQVDITSHNSVARLPYFRGYIPVFTIARGD